MRLLLLSLLLFSGVALAGEVFRNPDVRTDVTVAGDRISFTFGFHDIVGKYEEWRWQDSASHIDSIARAFGLPEVGTENPLYSPQEIAQGLFVDDSRLGLRPDYSALASRYFDSVAELTRLWKAEAEAKALSERQAVELLLVFLQDFPYKEVPPVWDRLNIGGLFVPPLVFRNGWADCDSKALLMAIVLSHDPLFENKLAMILVPGHALLGIEMQPSPYDEIYDYENHHYVVAEPTGLARTPLGRKNSPYSQLLGVVPITLLRNLAAPFESAEPGVPASGFNTRSAGLRALTSSDCPPGGVLTDTAPRGEVRIQSCFVVRGGKPVKDGPEVRFGPDGAPAERRNYTLGVQLENHPGE